MKNNFAKNLRKIRKAQKLSREQLAKKARIGASTIYGYESGINEPTLTFLIILANTLGVSLDELVCAEERREKKKPYIRA